jgi:hypothetical protein
MLENTKFYKRIKTLVLFSCLDILLHHKQNKNTNNDTTQLINNLLEYFTELQKKFFALVKTGSSQEKITLPERLPNLKIYDVINEINNNMPNIQLDKIDKISFLVEEVEDVEGAEGAEGVKLVKQVKKFKPIRPFTKFKNLFYLFSKMIESLKYFKGLIETNDNFIEDVRENIYKGKFLKYKYKLANINTNL